MFTLNKDKFVNQQCFQHPIKKKKKKQREMYKMRCKHDSCKLIYPLIIQGHNTTTCR